MTFIVYLFTLQKNQSVSTKKSSTSQFRVSADVCGATFCVYCWSYGRFGSILCDNKQVAAECSESQTACITAVWCCCMLSCYWLLDPWTNSLSKGYRVHAPSKVSISFLEHQGPHLVHCFLGRRESVHQKRHVDHSIRVFRAHSCDQHADWWHQTIYSISSRALDVGLKILKPLIQVMPVFVCNILKCSVTEQQQTLV